MVVLKTRSQRDVNSVSTAIKPKIQKSVGAMLQYRAVKTILGGLISLKYGQIEE